MPEDPNGLNWTRDERVMVPAGAREHRLAIRRADWDRLGRRIGTLEQGSRLFPKMDLIVGILFGIAGTAALTIVPLLLVANRPSWALILYVLVFVFTGAGGFICILVDRGLSRARTSRLTEIREDMRDVEDMFKAEQGDR